MPSVRPSPRHVLWPLGLGTALSLIGDATLYTVLPTHTVEAGVPLTSVGLLLGVNRAIRVLLNGPMGAGYDRLPRRHLLVPAFFVGAFSTLLVGVTRGFWPLLAARLLWGLAWSAIWVGGNTVVLDISGDTDRGRWSGFYQVWFFTGVAAGAFLGGALTDQIGYHAALRSGAALTTLGALAVFLFLPETRSLSLSPTPGGPDQSSSEPGGGRWRSLLGIEDFSPPLRAAILLQGGNRFAFAGVVVATLGLLLQQRLGDQPALLGRSVGVATVTGGLLALRLPLNLVSAPLTGLLSDRAGDRLRLGRGLLLLGGLAMLLLALPHPLALFLGFLVGVVVSGGLQTLAIALVGDGSQGQERGRAMGLLHTVGDLTSALGPPLAYGLLPVLGVPALYLLCAFLFSLTWLLVRNA